MRHAKVRQGQRRLPNDVAMTRALAFGFVVACGGASATAPTPPQTRPASSHANVAAAPEIHTRAVSEALARAWPIADPEMLLYVDVGAALSPDLVLAGVVSTLPATASTAMPAAQMTCIRDALGAAKEAVAGTRRGALFAVRFDPAHVPPLRPCFGKTEAATVRGADNAWKAAGSGEVMATSRDLFLMGNEDFVETAIERAGTNADVLRRFGLVDREIARVHIDSGGKIDGTFSAAPSRLSASFDLDARSAHDAEDVAKKIQAFGSELTALPPAEHDVFARLLAAVHATPRGKHVDVTFSLDEPVTDQARDLGVVVSFTMRSIDEYVIASKQAEARNGVGAIAKDLATAWEREEVPSPTVKHKKKLVSFPAVPSTVPRGVQVTTKPEDWKAWAPIQFEMDAPQRYQFEVRAAQDGLSATIIARGDLDGNGKTSLFELAVEVGRDGSLTFAPTLKETNPAE